MDLSCRIAVRIGFSSGSLSTSSSDKSRYLPGSTRYSQASTSLPANQGRLSQKGLYRIIRLSVGTVTWTTLTEGEFRGISRCDDA
jgi:hypothetical protein